MTIRRLVKQFALGDTAAARLLVREFHRQGRFTELAVEITHHTPALGAVQVDALFDALLTYEPIRAGLGPLFDASLMRWKDALSEEHQRFLLGICPDHQRFECLQDAVLSEALYQSFAECLTRDDGAWSSLSQAQGPAWCYAVVRWFRALSGDAVSDLRRLWRGIWRQNSTHALAPWIAMEVFDAATVQPSRLRQVFQRGCVDIFGESRLVPVLLHRLALRRDTTPDVLVEWLLQRSRLGQRASLVLVKACTSRAKGAREGAMQALLGLGRDALEPARELVSSKDRMERHVAAQIFSAFPDEQARGSIVAQLKKERSRPVRMQLERALFILELQSGRLNSTSKLEKLLERFGKWPLPKACRAPEQLPVLCWSTAGEEAQRNLSEHAQRWMLAQLFSPSVVTVEGMRPVVERLTEVSRHALAAALSEQQEHWVEARALIPWMSAMALLARSEDIARVGSAIGRYGTQHHYKLGLFGLEMLRIHGSDDARAWLVTWLFLGSDPFRQWASFVGSPP